MLKTMPDETETRVQRGMEKTMEIALYLGFLYALL